MRSVPSSSRSRLAVFLLHALISSAGCLVAAAQTTAFEKQVQSTRPDTVSAAVAEASRRFSIPESWIRAVMQRESGQNITAVSPAGAIGLMQVMPGTYAELQGRYGLGADPFDIYDNILAGTAYLREMFDRFGAAGFLAAYNAGPQRWEEHLASGKPLPDETIDYAFDLGAKLTVADAQSVATGSGLTHLSPLESLIFVDLGGTTPDANLTMGSSRERDSSADDAAVKAATDSIFVRERSAAKAPSGVSSLINRSLKAGRFPRRQRSSSKTDRHAESSLFVAYAAGSAAR